MRLFWELVYRALRRQLTYRAAMLAGLVTNFFFGIIRVAILLALTDGHAPVGGYTAVDLITYTALTQSLITLLEMFGWYELMKVVYSGDVGSDLLKPTGFFNLWLAQDLGHALVHLLLRGVLFMVLFELIYDLVYPPTVMQWLAFSVALLLSWGIGFAWRFLINLAAFWTPQAKGVVRFGFILSWFFSGFMMPLALFPAWVQQIAFLTPFPYLIDVPVEVYLGILEGSALIRAVVIQLLWVTALVALCQIVLGRAVRRLVILGG